MNSIFSAIPVRRRSHGFTLVEMLVVIAIMSILMTAGAIGLGGMGGKGVTSGVATAEGLFDEARGTAIGKNLRACVLIAKKLDNNSAEDLRRIVVAYEETETDTTKPNYGQAKDPNNITPRWELSSRGAVLPDQTFYSIKLSKKDHEKGTGTMDTVRSTNFVGTAKTALTGEYYVYVFNSQGICTTPGASFIIGTGARNSSKSADTDKPRVTTSGRRDFGGFVVWRNGRTSVFRSPDQMGSEVSSLNAGNNF